MAAFGRDFTIAPTTCLYEKDSHIGTGFGLLIFFGLFMFYNVLQMVVAVLFLPLLTHCDFLCTFKSLQESPDLAYPMLLKAALVGTLPTAIITAVLIWFCAGFRGGHAPAMLALRWPKLGWAGWLIVVGAFLISMFALTALIGLFVPDQPDEVKDAMQTMGQNHLVYWLSILSVAIGAPLAEEFLFRGYLYAVLAKSRLGFSGAITISSVVWASIHASTASWVLVSIIFVMGLFLGVLLMRYGSLWVTLICHGVWNSLAAILMAVTVSS